ncbi:MAG TPA: hypothetical protein VFZ48_04620 [Candidatus Saccharimonadales bacterium]
MFHAPRIVATIFGGICVFAISLFILLFTLQTTVLQRQNVKEWLVKGDAYTHISNGVITHAATGNSGVAITQQQKALPPAVQRALTTTFSPEYLQRNTEQALDGFYDWLEGKRPSPESLVTLGERQQDFATNLSRELQKNMNSDAAKAAAQAQTNQLAPLFNQTLAVPALQGATESPQIAQLPALLAVLPSALVVLLVVAVSMAILAVVSQQDRQQATKQLATRLVISMSITFAAGLGLAAVGTLLDLQIEAFFTTGASVADALLAPLVDYALPAIGGQLMVCSGSVIALGCLALLYSRTRNV